MTEKWIMNDLVLGYWRGALGLFSFWFRVIISADIRGVVDGALSS